MAKDFVDVPFHQLEWDKKKISLLFKKKISLLFEVMIDYRLNKRKTPTFHERFRTTRNIYTAYVSS